MKRAKKAQGSGQSKVLGWDGAIAEAEDQIQRAKRRITMLQGAIQVFMTRRDAGEQWPVNESAATGH